jgi:uncharacterized membrane protein
MDTANPLENDVFGKIVGHPQQFDQASESRVFRAVLYHCVLVLAGPIVAFFGTKTLLLGPVFQWDSHEVKTDVVSAVVAVIVLHIALGFYIVHAYFSESDPKHQIGKRD